MKGFGKKGIAFIWLIILCLIILMGLFYVMLDQPIQKVKNMTVENVTGTIYEQPYQRVNTIWDNFLWFFLLGVFAFGITIAITRPNG